MWSVIARCIVGGIIGTWGVLALYLGLLCFSNVNALLRVAEPGQAVVEQSDAGKLIAWYAPDGKRYAVPAPAPGAFVPDKDALGIHPQIAC